jgi:hypothetical protein
LAYGSWVRLKLSVVVVVVLPAMGSASCFGGSSHSVAVSTSPGVHPLVITCDQIIIQAKAPPADSRRLLGVLSVPPAYIPQVVRNPGGGQWPYMEKAGLVVRANRLPVTVSVPQAWRTRAAITWGNGKPVGTIRFSPCPSPPNVWNAYAGGFFLSSRGACVPLVFQVGQRSQVVRFGIDRRCD